MGARRSSQRRRQRPRQRTLSSRLLRRSQEKDKNSPNSPPSDSSDSDASTTPKLDAQPWKADTCSVYTAEDYNSNDGMLTTVWGPSVWHTLHTMSFNYPVQPTPAQKRQYMNFVYSLRNVLPCGKCRKNLTKNLRSHPLKMPHMANRESFSRYIFDLHEVVNQMLGKKSGLTYEEVRNTYENFRSRCTKDQNTIRRRMQRAAAATAATGGKTKKRSRESGCVKPMYGKKAKCVIHIVPQEEKCPTFSVDKKCIKKLF